MRITLDYHIYKDIIEPCTLYDKDNNKIKVVIIDYNEKTKKITLDFIGLESRPFGKIY